jgi:hypothetical protein
MYRLLSLGEAIEATDEYYTGYPFGKSDVEANLYGESWVLIPYVHVGRPWNPVSLVPLRRKVSDNIVDGF